MSLALDTRDPREMIGGNNPPSLLDRLPIDYAPILREVEDLTARAAIAPVEVNDDADHGTVSAIITEATKVWKRVEAIRVDETAPHLLGQRQVNGFFNPHLDRIEKAKALLAKRGDDYLRRKEATERRAREEEERKRREAEAAARAEAQRKMREAAEAEERRLAAARAAREEEDRREREAARLKREEEDRVERAAAARRREEEDRQRRAAENASRQKNAAQEKLAREARERDERAAAEARATRETEERRAAEARRQREDEERAAKEASDRAMREAEEAMREADRREQERLESERLANAKAADLSRTRTGATTSSLREGFDFEVEDYQAVDLAAIRPYLKAEHIDAAIKAFVRIHKDGRPIAGVRIFPTTKGQYR